MCGTHLLWGRVHSQQSDGQRAQEVSGGDRPEHGWQVHAPATDGSPGGAGAAGVCGVHVCLAVLAC